MLKFLAGLILGVAVTVYGFLTYSDGTPTDMQRGAHRRFEFIAVYNPDHKNQPDYCSMMPDKMVVVYRDNDEYEAMLFRVNKFVSGK